MGVAQHAGEGKEGDAILVSQFFPPFNVVASQRALRLARCLLNHFNHVHVLTLPTGDLPISYLDREFGSDVLSDPRIRMVSIRPYLTGYGFVAKPRMLHRFVGAALNRMLCSAGADWAVPLHKELERLRLCTDLRLVVSTGGPFVPFIPVAIFAKKFSIATILDYRDLWSGNPGAKYPFVARALVRRTLERFANNSATAITTVSERCRRNIAATTAPSKVQILFNSPDRAHVEWVRGLRNAVEAQLLQEDCLNIVLTGTLYPQNTCRLLVAAIRKLDEPHRLKVRIHYYGPSSVRIGAEFARSGISGNLVDHGFVNKADSIVAMLQADVLLSLIFDGPRGQEADNLGQMTSKIFDYFLVGKPVLNIGPPHADLNQLAAKLGYGEFHSFYHGEEQALATFLRDALDNLAQFRTRASVVDLPDFMDAFDTIFRAVFPAALERSNSWTVAR